MYEYQADVLKIHDGDTMWLEVDLGCDVRIKMTCRLYGINAPELATQEGKDALAYVQTLVAVGDTVTVRTYKDRKEKYGRYLATIITAAGKNVNAGMLLSGHAVVYLPDSAPKPDWLP